MKVPQRARDHGAQWPKSEALLVDVTQYCSSKAAIHKAYSPDTKGVKHVLKNEERKAGMSIKRPVTITARVPIVKKKRHTIKNPLLCFAADKTANQTDKWDGKYNGLDCFDGVYFYTITYTFPTQQTKKIKGTVTLLR